MFACVLIIQFVIILIKWRDLYNFFAVDSQGIRLASVILRFFPMWEIQSFIIINN
jgi:hypothetical protein